MALQELQQTIVNDPLLVIAPTVAILATVFLTYAPHSIGKDTTLWRSIRSILPYIDDQAREAGFYTTYHVTPTEITGYWTGDINRLYGSLRSEGFILAPLAAHKSIEGNEDLDEVTSMAHFGKDLTGVSDVKRVVWKLTHGTQLHVTVFEAPVEEEYDYIITAHYEKSAYSPFTAYQHMKGRGMDIKKGVVMTHTKLKRYDGYEKKTVTLRNKDT